MSHEIWQFDDKQPQCISYFPKALASKLKISRETLRKYATAAKIPRPTRGKRDFRYSVEDIRILCAYMEANASSVDVVAAVRTLMAELPSQNEALIPLAYEQGQEVFVEESMIETEEEVIVEKKRIISKKVEPQIGEDEIIEEIIEEEWEEWEEEEWDEGEVDEGEVDEGEVDEEATANKEKRTVR